MENVEKYRPTWSDAETYRIHLKNEKMLKFSKSTVGGQYIDLVEEIILKKNIKSLWDYGCGPEFPLIRGLREKFPFIYFSGYDPFFEVDDPYKNIHGYISSSSVDMIVCTDVVEHIREEELNVCFNFWKIKNPRHIFVATVNTRARAILPDGTNAHKIVKPMDWWQERLQTKFQNYEFDSKYTKQYSKRSFYMLLNKKT